MDEPVGSFEEAERFAWRIGLSMTPAERMRWLEDTLAWAVQMQQAAERRPSTTQQPQQKIKD